MARRNARSVSESIVKYSGDPKFLGFINFTSTAKTNSQASTPFNHTGNALLGKVLLLQPDQNVYVLSSRSATGTVTTTNGVLLYAGERIIWTMDDIDVSVPTGEFYGWLDTIRATADGNLRVWELT